MVCCLGLGLADVQVAYGFGPGRGVGVMQGSCRKRNTSQPSYTSLLGVAFVKPVSRGKKAEGCL